MSDWLDNIANLRTTTAIPKGYKLIEEICNRLKLKRRAADNFMREQGAHIVQVIVNGRIRNAYGPPCKRVKNVDAR